MCRTCWRRRCDAQHRRFRADFPGIGTWHYLDSGATAQKPQAVIDATVRAMGVDYATVHRGVYNRSAQMTLAYEAARRTIARFIGGDEHEIVFTRGATEAINLVAASWGAANLKLATASCSPRWSIIRTSCRGRSCVRRPVSRSMSAR
jgi:selenocysteine lyase/cysteine desulfurase